MLKLQLELPGTLKITELTTPRLQERLALAARGRLGRLMKEKSKRKDLNVPPEVRDYWNQGSKKDMSELFRDLNFDKAFW